MATWRAIQSSAPHSRTLSWLSDASERVFWRMLATSDPWGRLDGLPWRVKSYCLPLVDVGQAEVEAALDEMIAAGRIVLYGDGQGGLTCQLIEFDRHQPRRVLERRGPSRFPTPPSSAVAAATTRLEALRLGTVSDCSPTTRRLLVERSAPKTEDRTEESSVRGSPTAVARSEGLPFEIESLVSELADADEATAGVIGKLATGLPEAAIARAREALHTKRAKGGVRSESGYVVATLKRIREESGVVAA